MAESRKAPHIEFTGQFREALRLMNETDQNVFITGRAGTGKSTLLQYFRNNTEKNIAVLAPTGVAAVNIRGQTIHSFCGFRPDVTPEKAKRVRPQNKEFYKKLDTIVIDEISMVRADLLDSVDVFLRRFGRKRKKPFGGIQMIFIGDLYQLPPVVTSKEKELFSRHYRSPYFFDSDVFREYFYPEDSLIDSSTNMEFIELEKVYRQKDERFLNLLNSIRNNTATLDDLSVINSRYIPDFRENVGEFYICLTTTNRLAAKINTGRLAGIRHKLHTYDGTVKGDFDLKALPTEPHLEIKQGAQIMLLNNDHLGRWINGSIGKVVDIAARKDEPDIIWVELGNGEVVDVLPYRWEMYEFSYDSESKSVVSESVGSFTQYPLKLAWAVTIHKSQGMTFDHVIIDIGFGTFTHGQLYVALSRCTTLEGIVLRKPLRKQHILMDWRVVKFVTDYQYRQARERQPVEDRYEMIRQAIEGKKRLQITYLKTKDVKSQRIVIPTYVGELEYNGRRFPGLQAFCTKRNAERVFHLERILDMKILE
jgi:ATP-dependent exoDNAse (exonuclease V) alpha subunit